MALSKRQRALLQKADPLFISFEGGEGCGKSTQVHLLAALLNQANCPTTCTRDPGGCDNSTILRRLLVETDTTNWHPRTEALLFMAARNELIHNILRPALQKGQWVISDRFADSTCVYQGALRGLSAEELTTYRRLVVGENEPDVTIVLDMPVEDGLTRARSRAQSAHEQRFENLNIDFHRRVRQGFLDLAAAHPSRYIVVDARGTPEEVHARIRAALLNHISNR